MLKDCFDYALELNNKKKLLLSTLEIASNIETITFINLLSSKTLIALNSLLRDISIFKRDFIFSKYLSRLLELISCSRLE